MVAQAEALDAMHFAVDRERARHAHVLLEVRAREALAGVLAGLLLGLVPVERAHRDVLEIERHALLRIVLEGRLRVRHLPRFAQLDDVAVERSPVPVGHLDHFEAQAGGVEGVIVRDRGPAEAEQHAAIGQVEAHRALGVAFVRAVADAEPAAQRALGVEEVVVGALVEVQLGAERMH